MQPVRTVLAILLAASASALAADPPPAPPPVPQPITVDEVIDVRVVNVEAVVTDRGGRVLHGLTAADFQLLVDGREVPIGYFTEIRGAQAVVTPPASAADAGTDRPASPAAGSQLQPGTAVARNYLVFIDDGFAVGARRDAALARLRDGLRRLAPEDRMAIVAFGGAKLEMLSAWTGDKTALGAALDRAAKRAPRGNQLLAQQRSMAGDEEIARYAGEADQVAQELAELRVRVSPEVLTQLARSSAAAAAALRAFELPPGRRLLLLLSGGWSVATDPRLYAPLIEAANQLGYTLYPLDVATGEVTALRLFDDLARTTGGRALSSSGPAALARVQEETDSYYLLGFSPTWKADDRPHPLKVQVRRPDLEVRSRSSYSDMSRQSTAALKAQSVLLFGADDPRAGAGAAQLKVESGASRRLGRDEIEVPVTLQLPVSCLSFTGRGADLVAEVLLAVAALDDQGRRTELPEVVLHFRLASLPAAARTLRFRTTVKLRRAEQHLVFATVDMNTGAALTAQLTVHPSG
ncbi:MAG TPA: VWA domain-containing protein [Thermoanaerobaculia bacterium]|jgi:VWFA-related protein|nr:VWA domain-containing protein [Thermoanaerobaculia bacterium]